MRKSFPQCSRDVLPSLLRGARTSKRLRQVDLARLLQQPQSLVSRVESGERQLQVLELCEWLWALDADLVEFMRLLQTNLTTTHRDG